MSVFIELRKYKNGFFFFVLSSLIYVCASRADASFASFFSRSRPRFHLASGKEGEKSDVQVRHGKS